MTGTKQTEMFNELLARMNATRSVKNKDYANDVDTLANFRMVEQFDLPAWIGILARLGDKYARITEQARKWMNDEKLTFAVNEGMTETCVDLANYALLMAIAYQEWVTDKGAERLMPEIIRWDSC